MEASERHLGDGLALLSEILGGDPGRRVDGLDGGISLFHLSKIMGTSTTMIGDVYGHLLPDSEDYFRGLLDNYDAPQPHVSLKGTTP